MAKILELLFRLGLFILDFKSYVSERLGLKFVTGIMMVVMIVGTGVAVYLIQNPTRFFPKAVEEQLIPVLPIVQPSPQKKVSEKSYSKKIEDALKADLKSSSDAIPFGSYKCSKKEFGDADCSGNIDIADIRLWEIEFKRVENVERKNADFNNDNLVDLSDYAILKNNVQLPKGYVALDLKDFQKIVENVIGIKAAMAAENSQITDSYAVYSAEGNSMVINIYDDGSYSTTVYDLNNVPLYTFSYDLSGQLKTNTYYSDSGLVTREQVDDQFQVTNKTNEGNVVTKNYYSEDSFLTGQTWSTREAFENKQPPQAVTIPVSDGSMTLSILPNGGGILLHKNRVGDVIRKITMDGKGEIVNEDLVYGMKAIANIRQGFCILEMKNNLGGITKYVIHIKFGVVAVIQTDNKRTMYLATSKSKKGDQWEFTTINRDDSTSSKIVAEPIVETGANTPKVQELIDSYNIYAQIGASDTGGKVFNKIFQSYGVSPVQGRSADQLIKTVGIESNVMGVNTGVSVSGLAPDPFNKPDPEVDGPGQTNWKDTNSSGWVTTNVPTGTVNNLGVTVNVTVNFGGVGGGETVISVPVGYQGVQPGVPLTPEQAQAIINAARSGELNTTGAPIPINIPPFDPTAPVQPPTAPVQPPTAPVQPPTAPVQPPTAPVQPPTAPVQPAGATAGGAVTSSVPAGWNAPVENRPGVNTTIDGRFTSFSIDAGVGPAGSGTFVDATIKDNETGRTVATQSSLPSTGVSGWTDLSTGDTTISQNGTSVAVMHRDGSVETSDGRKADSLGAAVEGGLITQDQADAASRSAAAADEAAKEQGGDSGSAPAPAPGPVGTPTSEPPSQPENIQVDSISTDFGNNNQESLSNQNNSQDQ